MRRRGVLFQQILVPLLLPSKIFHAAQVKVLVDALLKPILDYFDVFLLPDLTVRELWAKKTLRVSDDGAVSGGSEGTSAIVPRRASRAPLGPELS